MVHSPGVQGCRRGACAASIHPVAPKVSRARAQGKVGLWLLVLAALAGCDDPAGTTGAGCQPASSSIRAAFSLADGDTLRLSAVVLDQEGKSFEQLPAGVQLRWSTSDSAVATVRDGLVSALRRGSVRVDARAGDAAASTAVTVIPVPTAMTIIGGAEQSAPTGTQLADSLAVRVVDRHGEAIAGIEVGWMVSAGGGSLDPLRSITDATGAARTAWRLGDGGSQGAEARLPTRTEISRAFHATVLVEEPEKPKEPEPQPEPQPEAPTITGIAPDTLRPGQTAVLTGKGLDAVSRLTVAGVAVTIQERTPTGVTFVLPARSMLPCIPTGEASLVVEAPTGSASRAHPLSVPAQQALGVGESLVLPTTIDGRCFELAGGSHYVLSIFNASTAPSARAAFRLRGAVATTSPAADRARSVALRSPAGRRARSPRAPQAVRVAARAHAQLLERNRTVAKKLLPSRAETRQAAERSVSRFTASVAPAQGDTLTLRIPAVGSADLCNNFTEVRARVAHVGTRGLVLEDVNAPLVGTMDNEFRALGEEFDTLMYPLVRDFFGDPLAFDPLLDNNGRIMMLFSPVVNAMDGIAGFVFPGDGFDRAECASSDQGEIFYARVPTRAGSDFNSDTPANWLRSMRSTTVHETKHLASYAQRYASGATSLEEVWLEEATARIAEELWAREVFGYGQRGNVDYTASLFCEVRPTFSACTGKPYVMGKHFAGLYDFYGSPEQLTPLGAAAPDDWTFYASGWLLVRWALDHATQSEAAFLGALAREPRLTGVANLSARTGKSWEAMLADWSLALLLDDLPHFSPVRPALSFPGWNTHDVFAGMAEDFPNLYPQPFPLAVRGLSVGNFAVEVPEVRGGSAALFELRGTGRQLLELHGSGGGEPTSTLRIAVARVE